MAQCACVFQSVAGIIASSDIPLGLPLAAGEPDFTVTVASGSARPSGQGTTCRDSLLNAEVPGIAACEVDLVRRILCVRVAPRVHIDRIQHFLTDHVLPRLAGLEGYCFHAAAVAVDERAFVLLGPSGAGKSTLAARLALDGARLIGDDCAHLRDGLVRPSYRDSRLWPDSAKALVCSELPGPDATGKVRLGAPQGVRRCDRPVPLQQIMIVDVEKRDVPVAEALPLVISQQFRFAAPDPVEALDEALDLIRRYGPVRTISRDAGLSQMREM